MHAARVQVHVLDTAIDMHATSCCVPNYKLGVRQDDRAMRMRKRTISDEDLPETPGELPLDVFAIQDVKCQKEQLHPSMLSLDPG